jgi:flagellar motor switch protein FliG
MGPEEAGRVLGQLDTGEIERIARAVMQTAAVSAGEARELLETIGEVKESRRLSGGPEVARKMLVSAFGEDRGETLFRAAVPEPAPLHFEFLGDLEIHQLRALLRDESAGAISVVLPHLPAETAGELLKVLPPEVRSEVVHRVGRMGRLNRDVVVRIEDTLREKIRRQGRLVTQRVDGDERLAAILNYMPPSAGTEILQELELADSGLAEAVRRRFYSTDLLTRLSDRDLSDLIRDFSDSEIALLLKGKSEEVRSRILGAVSDRRRPFVADEYAHLGPQKREDVDRIDAEVLDRVREREQAGAILVPREGERYI